VAKAKDPPKVMDVVHPGSSRPSQTSRPVITSNRNYLQADPMLSTTKSADAKSEPAVTPSQTAGHVIKPPADLIASEAAKKTDEESTPSAPELKKVTITEEDAKLRAIDEPLEEPKPDAELEDKTEPEAKSAEEKSEPKPEPEVASKIPEPMPEKVAKPVKVAESKSAEKSDKLEQEASDNPELEKPAEKPNDEPGAEPNKPDSAEPEQDNKDLDVIGNTLPVEDEPAAKQRVEDTQRQKELEHLIESRKYALPINTRGRRRAMLWSLVVIVLLALVAVDLLADLGTITLPFSLPHTNFFS